LQIYTHKRHSPWSSRTHRRSQRPRRRVCHRCKSCVYEGPIRPAQTLASASCLLCSVCSFPLCCPCSFLLRSWFLPSSNHLSVTGCWASSGYTAQGCAALEQQLRACMDAPVRTPTHPSAARHSDHFVYLRKLLKAKRAPSTTICRDCIPRSLVLTSESSGSSSSPHRITRRIGARICFSSCRRRPVVLFVSSLLYIHNVHFRLSTPTCRPRLLTTFVHCFSVASRL
jgi:hypothetical protein